jgi:hypothetical protein
VLARSGQNNILQPHGTACPGGPSRGTLEKSDQYETIKTQTRDLTSESSKIPTQQVRSEFLFDCWIEALCTAEIRVLGWLYREFFGRPFHPDNF